MGFCWRRRRRISYALWRRAKPSTSTCGLTLRTVFSGSFIPPPNPRVRFASFLHPLVGGSMPNSNSLARAVVHIPTGIANAYLVKTRRGWYLIDTGTAGNAEKIVEIAERHFGERPPEAILLTHGHFDHAGNAAELSDHWDAQVFAHRLELPFLTGKDKYPPPDPTVGGFMGFMIRFFPNKAYDLGDRVAEFPRNPLPGWELIETPGHSPGHCSFFRSDDHALIAGDAITTVKQCNMVTML